MRLTIAICTWNRAPILRQTLEQMTRLVIPDDVDWELLVVNNNCTDTTDAVLDEVAERLPLKRLFEPRPGKSNAANLALREATGDYIIWTDDDVLVNDRWIAAYTEAFARYPDVAIFGGPIEAWFEGTPPTWLRKTVSIVHGAYGILDLGADPVRLTQDTFPYGGNMAVRTREQRTRPYSADLGPSWGRPGSGLRSEEAVVLQALMAYGCEGRWVPGARVRHHVPEAHQCASYLRKYYFGQGEYRGLVSSEDSAATLLGRPRWWWRRAIVSETQYRVRRLFARPEVWVEDMISASAWWGQIHGYARRHETKWSETAPGPRGHPAALDAAVTESVTGGAEVDDLMIDDTADSRRTS